MKRNGIVGSYELMETTEPPSRKLVEEFDGLNITTPLKEKVLDIAEWKDHSVELSGAANTLQFNGKIRAFNTDYEAILKLLRENNLTAESALVIGAGGASRAAIAALREFGTSIINIQNRPSEKVRKIIAEMGVTLNLLPSYDIVVNALPPSGNEFLAKTMEGISFRSYIDFNYLSRSHLAVIAEKRGIKGITGMDILIMQALISQEVWNGRKLSPLEGRER